MIEIRNPSLEFNWLPMRFRKGLETPRVFLVDGFEAGGFYAQRTSERCVHPLLDVDHKDGAFIALCQSRDAATLAHEHRHHQQFNAGIRFRPWPWSVKAGESYRHAIVRYFKGCAYEKDALDFEIKYAPKDLSLEWSEWLRYAV